MTIEQYIEYKENMIKSTEEINQIKNSDKFGKFERIIKKKVAEVQ